MHNAPHIRRFAPLAALTLSLIAAPVAHAGLLAPRTIDAGTGKDSVEVGGSIGNHRAWAAFVQETGGVERLYVDSAHGGSWARPFLADRGNAVTGAGLAGSNRGALRRQVEIDDLAQFVLCEIRDADGRQGPVGAGPLMGA